MTNRGKKCWRIEKREGMKSGQVREDMGGGGGSTLSPHTMLSSKKSSDGSMVQLQLQWQIGSSFVPDEISFSLSSFLIYTTLLHHFYFLLAFNLLFPKRFWDFALLLPAIEARSPETQFRRRKCICHIVVSPIMNSHLSLLSRPLHYLWKNVSRRSFCTFFLGWSFFVRWVILLGGWRTKYQEQVHLNLQFVRLLSLVMLSCSLHHKDVGLNDESPYSISKSKKIAIMSSFYWLVLQFQT